MCGKPRVLIKGAGFIVALRRLVEIGAREEEVSHATRVLSSIAVMGLVVAGTVDGLRPKSHKRGRMAVPSIRNIGQEVSKG